MHKAEDWGFTLFPCDGGGFLIGRAGVGVVGREMFAPSIPLFQLCYATYTRRADCSLFLSNKFFGRAAMNLFLRESVWETSEGGFLGTHFLPPAVESMIIVHMFSLLATGLSLTGMRVDGLADSEGGVTERKRRVGCSLPLSLFLGFDVTFSFERTRVV